MTLHQAQWDQELEEQTNREIEDGRRAAAAVHRQAVGDGVATDGSRLFFVPASTGLPCNHGHNSNIERQQYADVLDSVSAHKRWQQSHHQQQRSHHRSRQLVPSKGALLALSYMLTTSVTTSVVEFSTICVHR
jgi:hypothetical protein